MYRHLLVFKKVLPAVLLFVFCFISLYQLFESPPVWYDEGIYQQVVSNITDFGVNSVQVAPGEFEGSQYVTVGYPLLYPASVVFHFFGNGVLQARLVAVLFLVAFIIAAYYLVLKSYGKIKANLTLLVLGSFPILYGNGKAFLGEVPGLLFLILFLIGLYFLEKKEKPKPWQILVTGLFAGLSIATKPLFILIGPAFLIALIWYRKHEIISMKTVVYFTIGVFTPILVWVINQFGPDASFGQVISYYANPYAIENLIQIISNNFIRLFTEVSPIYTSGLLLVWFFSVFINLRKGNRKARMFELTAFFFALLVLVAYLRTDGAYRYFFEVQVMALIFLAPSLLNVVTYIRSRFGFRKLFSKKIAHTALLLLAIVHFYQIGFDSWVAQAYESNDAEILDDYFRNFDENISLFIYNVPEIGAYLQTRNYYQYIEATPVSIVGESQLDLINEGLVDRIIIRNNLYRNYMKNDFPLYQIRDEISFYTVLERVK